MDDNKRIPFEDYEGMTPDEIEQRRQEEEIALAVWKMMEDNARGMYIANLLRQGEVLRVQDVLSKYFKNTKVKVIEESKTIKIEGKEIESALGISTEALTLQGSPIKFTCERDLLEAMQLVDSIEAYPRTDGTVGVTLGFYNTMIKVAEPDDVPELPEELMRFGSYSDEFAIKRANEYARESGLPSVYDFIRDCVSELEADEGKPISDIKRAQIGELTKTLSLVCVYSESNEVAFAKVSNGGVRLEVIFDDLSIASHKTSMIFLRSFLLADSVSFTNVDGRGVVGFEVKGVWGKC